MEDLYFANGFVHAQDRFWQMEFQRRVGSGRLSEFFGEATLETDIFLRTLGLERITAEEYELLDDDARRSLDAYVAGINAYIRDRKPGKVSFEYSLLALSGVDVEIGPWRATDSLTWAKLMAWSLDGNLSSERFLVDLLRSAGVPGAEQYYAPYRGDMPYVLPAEERRTELGPGADETAAPRTRWLRVAGGGRGEGTNAWVVSGDRTESGKPILVNDTHLSVQMPSIWYEVGLHIVDESGELTSSQSGGRQMRGFSFPGFPGVIIGHNDRIAWGIADFGDDTQDLFIEQINPVSPNQYLVNGEWREMELVHERIDVQGREKPVVHVVRRTRHGPIVSDRGSYEVMRGFGYSEADAYPANFELTATALSWPALEPGQLWNCFHRLQAATSYGEFRTALGLFNGPILNFVYADVDGNIGYQVAGHIPIRRTGRGRLPVPGWTDKYAWTGRVPFDKLPHTQNPKTGYVVAANNPAVPFDYPYDLGTTWANGYRARRIVELIEEDADGLSVDDVIRIQGDTFDRTASELVPSLAALDLAGTEEPELLRPREPTDKKDARRRARLEEQVDAIAEEAKRMLLDWDFHMDAESAPAAVYGLFYRALAEEAFADQLPYDRWETASNRRMEDALHLMLEDPESLFWDDVRTPDHRERRDEVLVRAFRTGLRDGIETLGDNPARWEWGALHTIEFREPTLGESGKRFIENIFNLDPVPVSGNTLTVYHTGWKHGAPFETDHSTSNRQIITLGDFDASLMIHAPGQSGHARHRHYDDLVDPWREAGYHPALWSREEAERGRSPTLRLEPVR